MSWKLKVRDKFSAAHFLRDYQGKCEKLHGHTFQVEVEIAVTELDRTGLGIDFVEIKKSWPGFYLSISSLTKFMISTPQLKIWRGIFTVNFEPSIRSQL